jgi:predicted nucleic acid-binding protein
MVYLTEKGILPQPLLDQLFSRLQIANGSYTTAPLDVLIAQTTAKRVPWADIPELADRVIAATAIALDLPLLTKDERIRQSSLVSILW